MNPTAAISITARDKTGAGIKSAEKSLSGLSRKTQGLGKRSGLAEIGNQLEKLTSIRGLGRGFEDTARGMSLLGATSQRVAAGMSTASGEAVGMAASAGGLLEIMGATAAGAATLAAGFTSLAVAGGFAGWKTSKAFAAMGTEIDRTATSIGVSTDELQETRAIAERFGLTADAATSAMDGLATSIYGAKTGANNLAAGVLTRLGVKLRQTKDGATDVHQAMLDLSDAIARQKDPMKQRAIANVFGVDALLPVLRQGSSSILAEEAEFSRGKLALPTADLQMSKSVLRRQVTAEQHIAARAAHPFARSMMAGVDTLLKDDPGMVIDNFAFKVGDSARALVDGGKKAGQAIVDGAQRAFAAATSFDGFEEYAQRIERQESGGKQFDKKGNPLISHAGAIGVMQMMPATAEATARQHGVPFNLDKLKNDINYNRMLARLHLRDRYDANNGNEVMTSIDYNAGQGRTAKMVRQHGDPSKGEISDAAFAARIPIKETKDYVANTAHFDRSTPAAPVVIAAQGRESAPAGAPQVVVAPAGAPPSGRAPGAQLIHTAPPPPSGRAASAIPEPAAAPGRPATARVDIHLHNAPKGTVARVSGSPNLTPTLRVMRALDD